MDVRRLLWGEVEEAKKKARAVTDHIRPHPMTGVGNPEDQSAPACAELGSVIAEMA